jgi:hypothetical protein
LPSRLVGAGEHWFRAKCSLSPAGLFDCCDVIKDEAAVEHDFRLYLATWRFDPARFHNKPVRIDYVVQVRLGGRR